MSTPDDARALAAKLRHARDFHMPNPIDCGHEDCTLCDADFKEMARLLEACESRWAELEAEVYELKASIKVLENPVLVARLEEARRTLAAAGKPEPRTTSEVTDEMIELGADALEGQFIPARALAIAEVVLDAAFAVGAANKEEK